MNKYNCTKHKASTYHAGSRISNPCIILIYSFWSKWGNTPWELDIGTHIYQPCMFHLHKKIKPSICQIVNEWCRQRSGISTREIKLQNVFSKLCSQWKWILVNASRQDLISSSNSLSMSRLDAWSPPYWLYHHSVKQVMYTHIAQLLFKHPML